ncbi:MAG TPA: Hsp70 family protein [Bacteroidetes bacterium]|nr:Hsp70 family protein [Bacteroidota bacterium]
MTPAPLLGIDLGTTNSVVSILENNTPLTIPVDGEKLLPSAVCLTDEGFIVGKTARNMALLEPERTVLSVKRKMGQNIQLKMGERSMRPEEVSSLILQKLKTAALDYLQLPHNTAVRTVITVPAYFTEEQRGATKQAAEMAGLRTERIINEPTAAALSYGMSQMNEATYAVYDFGGGTFDVSVIESNDGLVEVLATTGNNHLGGDDLDNLLANYLWEKFLAANTLSNIKPGRKEMARLNRIAEQAKIKLSDATEVNIQESFFFKLNNINYHLEYTLSRQEFENLTREKIRETIEHLQKAVEEAKLKMDQLDGILLVGGSSRIPLVSKLISENTGIEPTLVNSPDEAVSHGATVQGAIIDDLDIETILVDITPHSLGVSALDEISLREKFFNAMAEDKKENKKKKNEEPPNLKAAMIIPKNTPIPASRTKLFHNVVPYQKEYNIDIYQGEGKRFAENRCIGEIVLKVPKPNEEATVEVTFTLDLNGLLKVTATETTTKQMVNATFKSSRGIKVFKAKSNQPAILPSEVTQNTLLKRAQDLLENEKIESEDAEDLNKLISQLKKALNNSDKTEIENIEAELLDLLYYLEEN